MKFSELILEQLNSIFKQYNLKVIEQRDDFLKLQSNELTIIIAHNQLDNSNTFWLGEKGKSDLVEINDKILEIYFKSQLKLSYVPVGDFVKNLYAFLRFEGAPLFVNIDEVYKLENFDLKRGQKYTRDLIIQQNLASADIAWNEKDYIKMVKILDEIDHDNLPSSYKLKYKIAKERG